LNKVRTVKNNKLLKSQLGNYFSSSSVSDVLL